MSEWGFPEWIALAAVLAGPMGGLFVAWYTGRRQDRRAEIEVAAQLRTNVEDALTSMAHLRRLFYSVAGHYEGGRTGNPSINPTKVAIEGERACELLARARVRHPDTELRRLLKSVEGSLFALVSMAWDAEDAVDRGDHHEVRRLLAPVNADALDSVSETIEDRLQMLHSSPTGGLRVRNRLRASKNLQAP